MAAQPALPSLPTSLPWGRGVAGGWVALYPADFTISVCGEVGESLLDGQLWSSRSYHPFVAFFLYSNFCFFPLKFLCNTREVEATLLFLKNYTYFKFFLCYKIRKKCPNQCGPVSPVTQVQIRMQSRAAKPLLCLIGYHWVRLVMCLFTVCEQIKSILYQYNCIHHVWFDLSRHHLTSLPYFFFSVAFTIFPLSAQPGTLEEWDWRGYVEGKICMVSETFLFPFMLISYKCIYLTIQKRHVK